LLDALRVARRQPVLVSETAVRPECRVITTGKTVEFGEKPVAQFGRWLRPEDRLG
jgi:hypothetical protein